MIHTIIFDWKRTLYNPDDGTLIAGAKELLVFLQSRGVSLILVGKGGNDMYADVKQLGVEQYFQRIVFQEGKKEQALFKPYISEEDPRTTLCIGDRVKSELALGKSLGATTLWVRQGKFADEMPENDSEKPDYTVSSLAEVQKLLASARLDAEKPTKNFFA